ncbi:MAG: repeat-containing protein, partial [Candidatus Berkelbacteria bacterium]|nr:repeat-containing protein [Candidatus Berkelbacteria bacterium]
NEFAGGSKNDYKILVDSNLDWGQDLYRIKQYIDNHKISEGYIYYPWDGDSALEYYGINLKPLPADYTNIKGKVIIAATYYQYLKLDWINKYPYEQITPGVFVFDFGTPS